MPERASRSRTSACAESTARGCCWHNSNGGSLALPAKAHPGTTMQACRQRPLPGCKGCVCYPFVGGEGGCPIGGPARLLTAPCRSAGTGPQSSGLPSTSLHPVRGGAGWMGGWAGWLGGWVGWMVQGVGGEQEVAREWCPDGSCPPRSRTPGGARGGVDGRPSQARSAPLPISRCALPDSCRQQP